MTSERGNHSENPDSSTNHDAAPAARASVGRPRTDKADLPTRCGTGNTTVTEPLPVFVSGSGSVTPVPYSRTDNNRVDYATNRGTTQPRNGALSDGPAPDSRVWETPYTPPQQATPPQGSVQGEDSFRDSRNAIEPVAWAVMATGIGSITPLCHDRKEAQQLAARLSDPQAKAVPLYRHPQPTLTDEEREAIEWAVSAARNVDHPAENTIRKLLERLGGER